MKNLTDIAQKYSDLILEAEKFIWEHPETGYREKETSHFLAKEFSKLGYKLTFADNITGFYTVFDTGRIGPEILILGELDSVICPSHKAANPKTGAVHACGHNAQCAALLGIAAALLEKEFSEKLCGKIKLCAVPAEELLELDYRSSLKQKGTISYFTGKREFLSRGYFDSSDIAFMVHTSSAFAVDYGAVGCIAKNVIFKGKSAHAGGNPWDGCNALYAATCGINAVNAIRETFKDNDIIRVHPIITHGGDTVNAIPERVQIESYVRSKSFDAISGANKKVNRAFCSGALSLGANIEINDFLGYSPLVNDKNMIDLANDAAKYALPEYKLQIIPNVGSGSTDMGDLSCIMPVVHSYIPGASGTFHGNDFKIESPETACISSAKWQLAMLFELLKNNAERANKIISEYEPAFNSKDDFLKYIDSFETFGERISYSEDSANIKTS